MANDESLEIKLVRMDVIKLLIFMNQLRPVSRKISVCMDGDWTTF